MPTRSRCSMRILPRMRMMRRRDGYCMHALFADVVKGEQIAIASSPKRAALRRRQGRARRAVAEWLTSGCYFLVAFSGGGAGGLPSVFSEYAWRELIVHVRPIDFDFECSRPFGRIRIRRVEPQHVIVAGLGVDPLQLAGEIVRIDHRKSAGILGEIIAACSSVFWMIGAPLTLIQGLAGIDRRRRARADRSCTAWRWRDWPRAPARASARWRSMSAVDRAEPKVRILLVDQEPHRIREASALDPIAAQSPFGERIEVVAGADVDHGLALVVDALESPRML